MENFEKELAYVAYEMDVNRGRVGVKLLHPSGEMWLHLPDYD